MPDSKFYVDRKDSIPVSMSYFLHGKDVERLLLPVSTKDFRLWYSGNLFDHGIRVLTDILKSNIEYPLVTFRWSMHYSEYRIFVFPIKKEHRSRVLKVFWKDFGSSMTDWLDLPRDETWYLIDHSLHLFYDTGSGSMRRVEMENGKIIK